MVSQAQYPLPRDAIQASTRASAVQMGERWENVSGVVTEGLDSLVSEVALLGRLKSRGTRIITITAATILATEDN